jgi:predicted nucleic acid-binding Zn ribbon protein
MDSFDETSGPSTRSCPECGVAVQPGQRRCTNCGVSVESRRRLARRTPLVAALAVLALGGGAVVVAQAEVTDRAAQDASAPADVASAPVAVVGNPLPAAKKPTSSPPKLPAATLPAATTPAVTIPSLTTGSGTQTNGNGNTPSKDGENLPEDGKADPNDLTAEKKLKVKRADNYDPALRLGVEFGTPKAAIDKRNRTVWDVNVPADGNDLGVGIVLDLGSTQRVSQLRIQTPTPGFGAVIYRADTTDLPDDLDDKAWKKASVVKSVTDDVVVPMSDEPEWARYVLLWLTTPVAEDDTRVAVSNLTVLP